MSIIHGIGHRLRALLRPTQHERELAEEIEHHLTLDDAQHGAGRARRRFGNVTAVRESARQAAGLAPLDVVAQDTRFALRIFRHAPGFTAVTIAVLAIGIGANTALFSAVNAILLRPLPFERPERVMTLSLTSPARANEPANDDRAWSYPKFSAFRDAQTIFRDLAAYSEWQATVVSGDQVERVPGETIGAGYLPTLGIRPALGRAFGRDDDSLSDGPRTVLLSDALWRRAFAMDSSVLGRTITLNPSMDPQYAKPYIVIGVLPPGFRGLSGKAEYWVSLMSEGSARLTNPHQDEYRVVARLKDGVSMAQAKALVPQLGALVDRMYPDNDLAARHWSATARELDGTRADPLVRRSLWILLGAAFVVLLIACANVANLFLLRAAGRTREIAARLALGASRGRVVRQLLTESLLLSLLGGMVGLVVAWWGTRALATLQPGTASGGLKSGALGVVSFQSISLDGTALVFAAVLTLVTGTAFGLAPAFSSTRASLAGALGVGGGSQSSRGATGFASRHVLAVVEITLAIVLLAGAGLMLESLANRLRVDPGFSADRVLTFRFTQGNRAARDSVARFYEEVVARVAALPGVAAVGLANCAPLAGGCSGTRLMLRDRPAVPRGSAPRVEVHWVTPAWFDVMRVPLERGRIFSSGDRPDGQRVVMVNETAVRSFWAGQDPIGRPVSLGGVLGFQSSDTAYVIGVVGDVHYKKLDSAAAPAVYLSYAQSPLGGVMLFVRTHTDPLALAPTVRRAMREIAPESPVFDLQTMDSRVARAMAQVRFSTILLVLFAAVALILATVGTYGVVSFGVAQRTREIGIRIALGATREEIVRRVVGQGLMLAIVGATIGSVGALATTGVLRSLLYDVKPVDPQTFIGIALVLIGVVVLATWLPARRAARVDPTLALRQ